MNDDFSKRVDKVLAEIKNMKMNQTVGGDSWVVYRSEVNYPIVPNRQYTIRFSPETNNNFVAVCKVTSPDRQIPGSIGDLLADSNVQGLWWRPYQFNSSTPVIQTFFVYSTVKGTVSVQDVTGLGLGA